MSAPHVQFCMECCRPCAVMGDDTPDTRAELAEAVQDWWTEHWAWTGLDGPLHGPPPPFTPVIYPARVVHVTEASARWLYEEVGCEDVGEAPCWMDADVLPDWWTATRAKPAVRVDCCDLDSLARKATR